MFDRQPQRSTAAAGFTLIETCIALTIAALMTGIASAGFSTVLERQRLRGTAAALASDLQWLRSQAVARNEALRLSLHNTPVGICTIVHTGQRDDCRCAGSGPAVCDGSAQALKTSHWPLRERISVQSNVSSMLFDPDQGTVSPAGSIRIVDSRGLGITHVVNVVGRVRSCSPSAAVAGFAAC
ncbi:GspH/FimT family pseudopilin [Piscinibacter sakaiensis]|uniref:GspH/FimT family pseudopilin n=1 Tax=Piscinibacter sakaiensis TaxID=1547922 RepID=UPI003AAF01EE